MSSVIRVLNRKFEEILGAAMLAGVYYVGALLDKVHRLLNR